jgi:hypothetical protein
MLDNLITKANVNSHMTINNVGQYIVMRHDGSQAQSARYKES